MRMRTRYSAGKFCRSAGRRPFWLEECEWNDPVLSADCYIEQVSVQFRFNSTANPIQVTTWDDQLHTSTLTLEWRSFNPCSSQGRQFPLVCQGQLFYYVLQLLCAELLANFLSHICTRRLHPSLDKFSNCVANFYNIPIPFPYVKSSGGSKQHTEDAAAPHSLNSGYARRCTSSEGGRGADREMMKIDTPKVSGRRIFSSCCFISSNIVPHYNWWSRGDWWVAGWLAGGRQRVDGWMDGYLCLVTLGSWCYTVWERCGVRWLLDEEMVFGLRIESLGMMMIGETWLWLRYTSL